MRKFILLVAMCCATGSIFAQTDPNQLKKEGNDALNAKNYQVAFQVYFSSPRRSPCPVRVSFADTGIPPAVQATKGLSTPPCGQIPALSTSSAKDAAENKCSPADSFPPPSILPDNF